MSQIRPKDDFSRINLTFEGYAMEFSRCVSYCTLFLFLAFAGCSSSGQPGPEAVNVEVQKVQMSDNRQDFAYSGTIVASETIPLSFSSPGTVLRVFVSEGQAVRAGELLAELDNATYRNAYQMAHTAEQQAEDAYNRLTPMYKNGSLPQVKYVDVETKLAQARAAAAIAKKSLDDCKLCAPADGFIGRRSVEPGVNVLPDMPVINIVKIKRVYALVPVSENEVSSVRKGGRAEITIAALDNAQFTGTVEEIGVVADPIAHTYKIKIAIANRNDEIRPGMICNVLLIEKNSVRRLVVPTGSVSVDAEGRTFVYVLDKSQSRALRKFVVTGNLLRHGIEIISGLDEGEEIVVAGQQKLADNSLVRVVNTQPQGSM